MTVILLTQIENEIARLLEEKLDKLEITPERATEISRFVLKTLPPNLTDAQVQAIIPSLDDHFTELASIVHKHMIEYEQAHKDLVLAKSRILLKKGHLGEASDLMKAYFAHKIS